MCGRRPTTHKVTVKACPERSRRVESWHKTIKRECIRPLTPLSLEDARRIVSDSVNEYNTVRLHSGIGYVTPQARLEGRDQQILAERHRKLAAARLARETVHRQVSTEGTTGRPPFDQPEPALMASVPVVA